LYLAPADLSYDLVARLLTVAEKRLQRQAAQVDQGEPQLFNLLVPDQNTVLRQVLEQKGYQQIRQNLEMVREPLTDLRPLGPLPAGLVERIVTDADLPAIWQTEQIAMADLWEHQVLTPEVYQRFVQMPLRDNHLFTVIWDGTQDVAHTLAFIDPEENQVNGYQRLSIWSTAVLPAYRHFSLGVYVLRRALEKARAAGMTSVSLATDPDYQSGVIDLYRFLRFTVVASQSRWRKPVFPTDTAAQASLGIAQSLFRGWPCPPK
jgi:ribosomal protein S18 acetylase RimI-like enzyme